MSAEKRLRNTPLCSPESVLSVIDLLINIHNIFRLISQISKNESISVAKQNEIEETIERIYTKLMFLQPKEFADANFEPYNILIIIIERLLQLTRIYTECIANEFTSESKYLKNINYFEETFVNKGFAKSICNECGTQNRENFEFIKQSLHVPIVEHFEDKFDGETFVQICYANVDAKSEVELTCDCERIINFQQSDQITHSHSGNIQIITLDRSANIGTEDIHSKLAISIPLILNCYCIECEISKGKHTFYLIGIIAYVHTGCFVTYIRNSSQNKSNCLMEDCCNYIHEEKIKLATGKFIRVNNKMK